MKRKWIKWMSWILLTPILLFAIVMILLYIPPVQNLLRKEATAYASKATGMDIRVERIDLRFPLNLLVRGVEVIQQPDTILSLESLNVRVQVLPLLKGKIDLDEVTLKQAAFNSANLLPEMRMEGMLGYFSLKSDGIDLSNEIVVVNATELSDTHVQILMKDTTVVKDTAESAPVNWKVELQRMKLKNVSFGMQLPADSMRMAARIGEAIVKDVHADLREQYYGLRQLLMEGSSANYDIGESEPLKGFDVSHVAVRDVTVGLDSLSYRGREMNAVIRKFSLNERSGLSVASLAGRFFSNDSIISVPDLKLQTPHSEIALSAHSYWELMDSPTNGHLAANLSAFIGKEDVILFAGDLSKEFKEAYPYRPLVFRADAGGNLGKLEISELTVDLPGAFSLRGGGTFENLHDSIERTGTINLDMVTRNLNFLTTLSGPASDSTIVIPENMTMKARADLKGSEYKTNVLLKQDRGTVGLNAKLNTTTEVYSADLKVDSLQLHNFLPKDSLYTISLSADVNGRGLDVMSRRASAKLNLMLDGLHYARYHLSDLLLTGALKGGVATAHLTGDNDLLQMKADAEYNLTRTYPDGKLILDIARLDLHKMGLLPESVTRPLVLNLTAEARRDEVSAHVVSGDLKLDVGAGAGVYPLMKQSTRFMDVLIRQIEEKELDHAALREALPGVMLSFSSGKNNLVADYLAAQKISYKDVSVKIGTAPDRGINGDAFIHTLKVDTLQLDTIFFTVNQDTTQMRLRGGVINGPSNPQFSFATTLTGEIRDKNAELMLEFKDGQGETGALLGINAQPLTGGNGKGDGMVFRLIPEEPIIAFRKFHFTDNNNWIYLHKNMRVYAGVDMMSDGGMGFRMHSMREDTVSLQNMNVEVRRIRLQDVTAMLPYFPEITGLFSLEAHYIQTEKNLQVSAEASIDELNYERQRVGDVALGVTWLPGEQGKQYLNGYLNHDDTQVLLADGKLLPPARSGKDTLEVNTTVEHFPLRVANAFIPDQMVTLSGDMDGSLRITGSTAQPLINGELLLDSVSVLSRQYGVSFKLDNRPLQIKNNRLTFDKFAIYSTENNPFTIDGYVDFRDLSRPMANLNMLAENYTLLDAGRTRESLVYGKVYADFRAIVRGPLDGLTMRGDINLLGNTDVSYILTDSPLTVQDRLGSLVTFTSFSDSTTVIRQEAPTVSLGGLDMAMMIHIDPAVRVKVDLDTSNDNRVELEGGGDLSMKYTPQGDLTLTGRYTMTGGLMKYALPVIAAKEFAIDNGSYVEWNGNPMEPSLNFKATDRIRASVSQGENGSRMVNFNVSIVAKNRLENLAFAFDVSAPEDVAIQNELASMGAEERGKQALYIMLMKTYLGTGPIGGGSGGLGKLNMSSALTSVLSSQINSLLGNIKNASLSVGVEDYNDSQTGGRRTDYSFRYSQRLFNNRFQIVIGGKVSQGDNVTNDAESFIDNISLEYRLDRSGTRYVRLFYDKNYESILEGEITETGVGLVLRKKLDKLSELFIFKKKKQ